MKKTLKCYLFIALFLSFCQPLSAQSSAGASSTANIITPISISKSVDMNFGNIAVKSSAGGTVVLNPSGTRTQTGGVTLPVTSGTTSAASFTVTGEGVYTYSITLPSSSLTIANGVNSMTVSAFTSSPSSTGTLTAGSQTVKVGATLNVNAAQATGIYTSTSPFNVTVNYN